MSRGSLNTAKLVVRKAVYEQTVAPYKQFLDVRAVDGQTALDVCVRGGYENAAQWLTALGGKANLTRRGITQSGVFRTDGPGPGPGGFHPGGRNSGAPSAYHGAYHRVDGYHQPQARHAYHGVAPEYHEPYASNALNATHAVPSSNAGIDSYLFGALELALGDAADDGEGVQSGIVSDRKRARALVKKVAELVEDRDDLEADLGRALARADTAESRIDTLKMLLEAAVTAKEQALQTARREVKAQREEERTAVLAALGLAERRAITMANEKETLREERDAIAEALQFVKVTTKTLFAKNEVAGDEDEIKKNSSRVADGTAAAADASYAQLVSGGGSGGVDLGGPVGVRGIEDTSETLQMLEVPLDD